MFANICRTFIVLFALCNTAWAAVNVNTATATQLQALPGIGPSKATAIIEYRAQNGHFTSIEQMDSVPGIGPATLANIRPHVVLADGEQPPPPNGPPPAETPSVPGDSGAMVNINTASATALQALPGIGEAKAAGIVGDRDANGPFSSCDNLQRVSGVGPATVAGLKHICTVE